MNMDTENYLFDSTAFTDRTCKAIREGNMTVEMALYEAEMLQANKSQLRELKPLLSHSERLREDALDDRLFTVMQALKDITEKWTITPANEFVTTYPHPVTDYEGRMLGIEFKSHKYNIDTMLPPVLAERYKAMYRDIRKKGNSKKSTIKPKVEPKWIKLTPAEINQICEMYKADVDIPKIAKHFNRSYNAILHQLTKAGLYVPKNKAK